MVAYPAASSDCIQKWQNLAVRKIFFSSLKNEIIEKTSHKVVEKLKEWILHFPNEIHTNGTVVKLIYYCAYFEVCPKSEIKCLKKLQIFQVFLRNLKKNI